MCMSPRPLWLGPPLAALGYFVRVAVVRYTELHFLKLLVIQLNTDMTESN